MSSKEELRKMAQKRTEDTMFFQKQNTDIFNLFIDDIVTEGNIRENINEDSINELAQSIAENGLLNPITVYRDEKTKKYNIIAGHRRYLACKKLGFQIIPSLIKKITSENQKKVIQLEENINREDLTTFEKAKAIKELLEIRYKNIFGTEQVDTEELLSKLLSINAKIEFNNLHDIETVDTKESALIDNLGLKTRQLLRYMKIFRFNDDVLMYIRKNPDIPLALIEVAEKYKDYDFVLDIFKDYVENNKTLKEIKKYYDNLIEKEKKKEQSVKKRVRVKMKLSNFNKSITELLQENVYIKDKSAMLEEIDSIIENLQKLKEKYSE